MSSCRRSFDSYSFSFVHSLSSSSNAKRQRNVQASAKAASSLVTSNFRSSSSRVPPLLIPPMVNSDVRERYPFLVAHVYNSTSYDLVWKLLSTYYRSDMIIAQELTGKPSFHLTFSCTICFCY